MKSGSTPIVLHRRIPIVTTDTLGAEPVHHGSVVHASAVSGANVLRDLREAITNTIGGKMVRYETLLNATIERALDTLEENAVSAGYDAVVGLRVSHPAITDGAIEVVVVGTGVWRQSRTPADPTSPAAR
ncbi:MAG: YbjQ family protein [Alphaproteobacteria bacterium]|nr:YbjQ family protein [Alphaproteobacteria bacterium]